jgi:hypothetical protein
MHQLSEVIDEVGKWHLRLEKGFGDFGPLNEVWQNMTQKLSFLDQTASFEPSCMQTGLGVWSVQPFEKKDKVYMHGKVTSRHILPFRGAAPSQPILIFCGSFGFSI